ncbi:MAG: hypothetical protein ACI8ZO_001593 [Flavobacteriales bacterium]|jgi:hypothetical protein
MLFFGLMPFGREVYTGKHAILGSPKGELMLRKPYRNVRLFLWDYFYLSPSKY